MTKGIIPAFSTGEISPEFTSSLELEKARNALYKCENMIVDVRGGVKNRPGTQFITECWDTELLSRLIPFQFNQEQAYMIEFTGFNIRVLKNGADILRDIVKSGTYQWTLSAGSEYYCELSGGGDPDIDRPLYVLENGTKMTEGTVGSLNAGEWGYVFIGSFFAIHVRLTDSTDPDTKADGYAQIPTSRVTAYSYSEIQEVNFDARQADVIYMFHKDHIPKKLTRTSDTDWTVTDMPAYQLPYKKREVGDDEIRINATNNGSVWTLTASSPIFAGYTNGGNVRLGFPIPADESGIYWVDFIFQGLVSDYIVSGLPDVDDPDLLVYQQVQNYDFRGGFYKNGVAFWDDYSTHSTSNYFTFDAPNKLAVLTQGSANSAKAEQAITTFANRNHLLKINVSSLTGTSPTVVLSVGTASGLSDIFTTTITTTGVKTFDVLPTQSTVFINLDTVGSTNGDVIKIDYVSFMSTDTLSASTQEQNTNEWRLGAWSDDIGYASKAIIDEQRLKAANSPSYPQTIWESKVDNYEDFTFNTPVLNTDGFSFNPNTSEINGIEWLNLLNGLNVGTAGEIMKVFSASGGITTPTDVNIKIDNAIGTLDLSPLTIGNSIIMTPRGKSEVSEVTTSYETQGFVANDLSLLAAHLFENRRIIKWAYARSPDSVIWAVLDNGELLGMSYYKEYDIWAWHKHKTPLGEGFKDVAVIPNSSDDNIDDVYFIVNRAEEGDTPNYYIEQLNRRITPLEAAYGLGSSGSDYDYRFLDSALTLNNPLTITAITNANPGVVTSAAHGLVNGDYVKITGVKGMTEVNNVFGNTYIKYKVANKTANTFELNDADDANVNTTTWGTYLSGGEIRKMVTTISGLAHLEGETVTAIADGAIRENLIVTSGVVILPVAAAFVHVGVPYTPEIETLDLDILTQTGSTQGRLKSISRADIYFKDSRGAEVASSLRPNDWWNVDFQNESSGEWPDPLYSGVKETKAIISKYNKQERLKIRGFPGLPIHIKRIIWDVDYGG